MTKTPFGQVWLVPTKIIFHTLVKIKNQEQQIFNKENPVQKGLIRI